MVEWASRIDAPAGRLLRPKVIRDRVERANEITRLLGQLRGQPVALWERSEFSIFSIPNDVNLGSRCASTECDVGYWQALMAQRHALEALISEPTTRYRLLLAPRVDSLLPVDLFRRRVEQMQDWLNDLVSIGQPSFQVRCGTPTAEGRYTGDEQNVLVAEGRFAVIGRPLRSKSGFNAEVWSEPTVVRSIAEELKDQWDALEASCPNSSAAATVFAAITRRAC